MPWPLKTQRRRIGDLRPVQKRRRLELRGHVAGDDPGAEDPRVRIRVALDVDEPAGVKRAQLRPRRERRTIDAISVGSYRPAVPRVLDASRNRVDDGGQ